MQLKIITPCSRLDNLPILHESVFKNIPKGFDVSWLIVVDQEDTPELTRFAMSRMGEVVYTDRRVDIVNYPSRDRGIVGGPQRNHAFTMIDQGHLYCLDDDTILHPNFYGGLQKARDMNNGSLEDTAVIGSQEWPTGGIRLLAGHDYTKKNHIDTGQFVLPRTMIGETRWDAHDYCGDGAFIEGIYQNHKDRFVFVSEPISYYNRLRQ